MRLQDRWIALMKLIREEMGKTANLAGLQQERSKD